MKVPLKTVSNFMTQGDMRGSVASHDEAFFCIDLPNSAGKRWGRIGFLARQSNGL